MFCLRQELDGLGMLREWIKRTQSITVGLLQLAARKGMVDHVKHGPNWSMMI